MIKGSIRIISEDGFHAIITLTGIEPEPIDRPYYVVVGEIENIGNTPVYNVSIRVEFFSSNGTSIKNLTRAAFLYVLPPGRKSPFIVQLSDELNIIASYRITDLTYKEYPREKPEKLKIGNSTFMYGVVTGTIKNVGEKDTKHVIVIATFYDEEGKVIAANSDMSINELAAGETKVFQIEFPFSNMTRPIPDEITGIVTAESIDYAAIMPLENSGNNYFIIFVLIITSCSIFLLVFLVIKQTKSKGKNKRR